MKLKVFPRLEGNSRRAFLRRGKSWGHEHIYIPREPLMSRLCRELGMSKLELIEQIEAERQYIREHYVLTGS